MGGLVVVKSANQLDVEQKEKEQGQREAQNVIDKPVIIDNLATHVKSCWEVAKSHRTRQPDRYTNCLRLRKGVYSTDKLNKIRETGGSDIYMNLVGPKCNAAKSWLSDLYAGSGDKPFDIEPTPVTEIDPSIEKEMIATALSAVMQIGGDPAEVKQMAERLLEKYEDQIKQQVFEEIEARMEGMSNYIEDILTEGDFRREFEAFLDDLVTYPVAIFKGAIYRREMKIKWVEDEQGNFAPQVKQAISRKFKRVSPFDFYPSPHMTNIGDNWHIEHIRYGFADLERMRGSKGYNTENINGVLKQYRSGGLREWAFNTSEREHLEGKQSVNVGSYEMADGLEWTGTIQGAKLIEWGIEQPIEDPYKEYSVSIVVVGDYTIKAAINPDPTGRPSYYKASYRSLPNSFDGEALPELIEDIQHMTNATARALVNNMAIGAQPQVAVDMAMQAIGSNVTSIYPGKVWQYTSKAGQTKAGVSFFSPDIKSQELLSVFERFERYAEEKSGIPSYIQGSNVTAGAGGTASGLSMLMNASSKTIKQIVRDIDIGVIEPLVSNLYHSAMLDPDVPVEYKGDAQVKARGSDALMHKEATAMRQIEFMNMTNNPLDMELIGGEGRLEMLTAAAANAEFRVGTVVPSKEEYKERVMNAQQQLEQSGVQQNSEPQAV